MSDSCGTFDAGSEREFGNAVLSLMAAVRDVWGLGTSVMQTLVQQTGEATDRPGQEPVAEFDPEATTSDCGDISHGGDLSSVLIQTWLICATSTLRYWRDLAEVYARYQPMLIRSVARRPTPQPSLPKSEDRVLADELRACLREISDVAVREARRLQRELEPIGERVARGVQPEAAGGSRILPAALEGQGLIGSG